MFKTTKLFQIAKCYCSEDATTERLLASDLVNFPTLTFILVESIIGIDTYKIVGLEPKLKELLAQYYDCGSYADEIKDIRPL